ncbi:hypothetical protein [Mesorhizobium sp.]|uniref:hypothetical protein n=1 Tax=Mesorhizobium sp. TaxID=1871066 RepID=UPI003BABA216
MKRQAGRRRLYQMAVCPQFDALSASSGGWGQVWGRAEQALLYPQGQSFIGNDNALTPFWNIELSPEPSKPLEDVRDNMEAGLFRAKAGQVTTTTTNRLLESEDSLK